MRKKGGRKVARDRAENDAQAGPRKQTSQQQQASTHSIAVQADLHSDNEEVRPSDQAIGIISDLEAKANGRKQDEVASNLGGIIGRVELALDQGGYATSLKAKEETTQSSGYDIKKKRQDIQYQRNLIEVITTYQDTLDEKQHLLQDVGDWLGSVTDLEDGVKSFEEIKELEAEYARIGEEVNSGLKYAHKVTERINDIGKVLLKKVAQYEAEDEEEAFDKKRGKHAHFGKQVVDDVSILKNPDSYATACGDIKQTLEAAVKAARKNQEKTRIRHGLKQWKSLAKAMDMRMEEFGELREVSVEQKATVEQFQRENDRLKMDNAKSEARVKALDNKVLKLQTALTEQRTANEDLQDMLEKTRASHESLLAKPKSVERIVEETAPTQITQYIQKTSSERLAESQSLINAAILPLQEEIESYKVHLGEVNKQVAALQKKVKQGEKETSKFQAKIENKAALDAKKAKADAAIEEERKQQIKSLQNENDSLHKQISILKSELECKNELIEHQETRLTAMKDELNMINFEEMKDAKGDATTQAEEIKRVQIRMKKDFDIEMARMKTFMEKERARHDAVARKLEQSHRDQLGGILKSSVHLLRAINRFKESVAVILDRENLSAAANDVRRIANLRTDDCPTDSRLLLTQMAGNAVELLVTIEFKLSQSLMNQRMEIKEKTIAKKFADRDLEAATEALKKARETSEFLAEKLVEVRGKLIAAEETLRVFKRYEGKRYSQIAQRYRRLTSQYLVMQRESIKQQNQHKEALSIKDQVLTTILGERDSLRHLVEKQQTALTSRQLPPARSSETQGELRLSVLEVKENLQLLEQAMEEDRIQKDIHDMIVDIMQRSIKIPAMRLRNLIERYTGYRRLTEARACVAAQFEKPLTEDRFRELAIFIGNLDRRLVATTKAWAATKKALDMKHQALMESMGAAMGKLTYQTGLVFIEPDCKSLSLGRTEGVQSEDAKSVTTGISYATTGSRRHRQISDKGSSISGRTHLTFPRLAAPQGDNVPDMVGKAMSLQGPRVETTWALPSISPPPECPPPGVLNTPRLLGLDINQHIRAAQKVLRKVNRRVSFPLSKADGYDYTFGELCSLTAGSEGGPAEGSTACATSTTGKERPDSDRQATEQEAATI